MNCLQSFHSVESRDKHFEYSQDNKRVKIEIPDKNSFVIFHDGQYPFKVAFIMYADFDNILRSVSSFPSDVYVYSKFAYGEVENPLKLYWCGDYVEVLCDYIE